ncbi:MAG TPA: NUDIX domain-containing protein [Trueperaceae bacterium]|nr:NUDIX domain-containing protein [Trueperaceae bacterium]
MTETTPAPSSSLTIGRVPSSAVLARFAESAVRDGRRLVVGALVANAAGRIYVQKRSQTRALFPGAWDIVGGHVEAGETVEAALGREVLEETGWTLTGLGAVVEVIDWEADGVRRREVDMLVTVAGDLGNPRLEAGKHSEGRWLAPDEAHVLLESRTPTDVWVHTVVVRAFELVSGVSGVSG